MKRHANPFLQVSATRKGLKNQLKNFWFSGVKRQDSLEVGRTEDGQYPHTSTEAQIRLLGDLAFMLRDYELAVSNYRLLSGDFRGDKAWKHLAGTLVSAAYANDSLDCCCLFESAGHFLLCFPYRYLACSCPPHSPTLLVDHPLLPSPTEVTGLGLYLLTAC